MVSGSMTFVGPWASLWGIYAAPVLCLLVTGIKPKEVSVLNTFNGRELYPFNSYPFDCKITIIIRNIFLILNINPSVISTNWI